ncbi:MAG: helix-turn-helix domain-containing protein [archaeon]
MDTAGLREAGLTEGEIKVYAGLLGLGASTTGPIVDKSGISRSIVYRILERLIQKGLVSYIIKDRTKFFQAASPNKILGYIDERRDELIKNKARIEALLPELLIMEKMSKRNEATIYLGYRGIRSAHEHIYAKLSGGEEYCYLGIHAIQPEEQHIYWKKDHLKRVEAGLKCRLLFNKDTERRVLKNRNSFAGCDARYMPKGVVTPACIVTYKDTTIIILQIPAAIAVEIVSQEIKDSFQSYFEDFWRKSVPFRSG